VIVKATNPTTRAKAILIEGGHAIVGPGKSVEIDVSFGKEKAALYERAGIVFTTVEEDTEADGKKVATATQAPVTPPTPPKVGKAPVAPPVAADTAKAKKD
jgi:hypothetical protein